jgi:hypothetical protein
VLSGFDPKLKMIQKPFENEVRKSTWKKRILFPSSLLFFLFSLLAHFLSPSSHFPSWAGPTRAGNYCRLLSPLLCR